MKRRRNSEGSYIHKGDMYTYSRRYTDPLTGETKRKYIRAKTQSQLDAKVCEWKARLELAQNPSGQMTVGKWCDHFCADIKRSVKTKTYTSYLSVIRNHIVPSLGKIPLELLTTAHVQKLLNRLSDAGLSAETVATVRRILCIVINRAIAYKLIDHNVAKVSRAPRIESKLPAVLSKEEVNRLLDYASDSRFLPETHDEGSLYLRYCYYVSVQVSIDSGIRQSELRAIQWGDLRDGRLYVNRAMEGSKIGTPKTKSGYRGITLSKTTLAVLRDWRVYQEAYCQKWQFWQVSDKSLIVSNGFGNPIDVQNMGKRWWRPLLKASGMPEGIHWHSLRATMATLLLEAGVPVKAVSERLGHSNVSVTLAKYAGIVRGIEEQSATIMDGILTKAVESPTVDVVPVTVVPSTDEED